MEKMDSALGDKELTQEDFESTYQIQDLIGQGTFAKVKQAINKKEELCNEYAVKIIDLPSLPSRRVEMRKREKSFVHLKHPNIIKFYHYAFTSNKRDGGKYFDGHIES